MTIILTTLQSKNGARLTATEFDTNFKTIQDTLNNTTSVLAGISSKFDTNDKLIASLVARINSQELTITALKAELQKMYVEMSQLSSAVSDLKLTSAPVQLKTLQTQVSTLSTTLDTVSLELKTKVSTSLFNSQISALNRAMLSK